VVEMTAACRPLPESAPAGLTQALALARPGAERHARVFTGVAAQVPQARAFASRALAGCPAREALMLCVTELCANAIQHTASGAGGAFTVEVARPADGVAYVAVTDAGGGDWAVPTPGRPPADADVAELAESGRGLALVAAYSNRCGYERAPGLASGYTVWAEATWPVPVAAGYIPTEAIWRGGQVPAAAGGGAA
jgi:serine/threonine-protein kinase RsbW